MFKGKDFGIKLFFYLVIGVYGVLIDIAVFNFAFNQIVGPGLNFFGLDTSTETVKALNGTISALIGGTAGLINNFLMNEYFVYQLKWHKVEGTKRFVKYTTAIIIGSFIIGKVFIFNFAYAFSGHQNATLSNLIAIAVGTFINYPINYFWTWGEIAVENKEKNK